MNKGINMITKKVKGFKLTNSISFGESMISAGFILKTIKVDPYVRINCTYPQRNWHQKTLEDTRGHCTKADYEGLHLQASGLLSPPVGLHI
jgi:hypothetical protein